MTSSDLDSCACHSRTICHDKRLSSCCRRCCGSLRTAMHCCRYIPRLQTPGSGSTSQLGLLFAGIVCCARHVAYCACVALLYVCWGRAHPRPRRWLNSIKYDSGACVYPSSKKTMGVDSVDAETALYASYFESANAALAGVSAEREKLGRKALGASGLLSGSGEALRWFAVAGDNTAASASKCALLPAVGLWCLLGCNSLN
jgi:hypothetical protein